MTNDNKIPDDTAAGNSPGNLPQKPASEPLAADLGDGENSSGDGASIDGKKKNKKRPWPLRLLKWVGCTIGILLLLIVLAVGGLMLYFTPERLASYLEGVAEENLNAEVHIGRAEYTFFSTFPRLEVKVTDVEVLSKSLDGLSDDERAMLPDGANRLITLNELTGAVDILPILDGEIHLHDVRIDRPDIRIVQATDEISNLDIFIESEDEEPLDYSFYIDRFTITGGGSLNYVSVPDDVDITMNLNTIEVNDRQTLYSLSVDSRIEYPPLADFAYDDFRFATNGNIAWNIDNPYQLGLYDFDLEVADFDIDFSTDIDFAGENLTFNTLDLAVNDIDLTTLAAHIPEMMSEIIEPLDTDMKLNLTARLTEPFVMSEDFSIPSAQIGIEIPDCRFHYNDINFNRLSLNIVADVAGNDLDASSLTLEHLIIDGKAMDINLSAKLTNIFNPRVAGHFKGAIDLASLPPSLLNAIDGSVRGKIKGDLNFDFRLNDLLEEKYHKLKFNGSLSLNGFLFDTPTRTTEIFADRALLTFNSDERYSAADRIIDSLLVVKLDIDTIGFHTEGTELGARNFTASIGTVNNGTLRDTTSITPIGGHLAIGSLRYVSEADSVKLRLREVDGLALLQRFEGDTRNPRLTLNLGIGGAGMLSPEVSGILRNSSFGLTANLRPRGQHKRSAAGRRSTMSREKLDSIGVEVIDFDVDNSLRSLLFRWDINASLRAEKGGLRTAGVPLVNRFSDLDLTLTTDSISLRSLDYRIGDSDFRVNGRISNIRGALSRRRPTPLKFDLNVTSDMINVNEIVSALTSDSPAVDSFTSSDLDVAGAEIEAALEQPAETAQAIDSVFSPILIPVNIDAEVDITADKVLYSNMLLSQFHGRAIAYHGTLNLEEIAASTDLGNIGLNALYSAPTADKINFGLGMNLKRIDIDRLPAHFPALDTLVPMMRSLDGIVDASIVLTADLTPQMDFDMGSLKAAMHFEGDSLVLFDNETFRSMGKWLRFKNRDRNLIDHLKVEMTVDNGIMNLYPFMVDIDRYKLGILGYNTLDFNLDYHISVLKSPIPFKFGIFLRGTPEKMKVSFGGAKFKEDMVARTDSITHKARINLYDQMHGAFRRGVKAARLGPLHINSDGLDRSAVQETPGQFSAQDSIILVREGFIEADTIAK